MTIIARQRMIKKNIDNMSTVDLVEFYARMATELGVKIISDPGLLQRLLKMAWERLTKRLGFALPGFDMRLRPCCLKNIIYLPYRPGCAELTPWEQVLTLVHECGHALRIRRFMRKYRKRASNWYVQYFTKGKFRATEETMAQCGELDLCYWLGIVRDPDFDGYVLSDDSKKFGRVVYERHHDKFLETHGPGYGSEAAGAAIRVLGEMGLT